MQTIHTDQKDMLNLVSVAKSIVGAGRSWKSSAEQSDRQGYCK